MRTDSLLELKTLCLQEGIELSDEQLRQFGLYDDLLIEWNQKINLTAITEDHDVVIKHFLDSMIAAKYFDFAAASSLIDVGTGAGFPGIPLKILYPSLQVTLLDSLNKRLLFLQNVIEQLNLTGVSLVHYRAEDGAHDPKLRMHFDVCVSRAVAPLPVLLEYCLPFVRTGGTFIAYKSGNSSDEIQSGEKAAKILGSRNPAVESFVLDGSDYQRTLLLYQKVSDTPKKYPRQAGLPKKKPL